MERRRGFQSETLWLPPPPPEPWRRTGARESTRASGSAALGQRCAGPSDTPRKHGSAVAAARAWDLAGELPAARAPRRSCLKPSLALRSHLSLGDIAPRRPV